MRHTRKKKIEMTTTVRMLAILLVPVVALILGFSAQQVWADDDDVDPVCWFNIEFNATDLDVGVRGFFDYESWDELQIEDPNENQIAELESERSLADQGIGELLFESGGPDLSKLSFSMFFDRYQEGSYKFDAETTDDDDVDDEYQDEICDDDEVECEADFTHVIPCAPGIKAFGNLVRGHSIRWKPVTQVVDTAATDAEEALVCEYSGELKIVGYTVIVETEVNGVDKEYKIDLPGNANRVTIPPEFIALSSDYEFDYEVIAIEESGNQTISEDEFCVGKGKKGWVIECPDGDDDDDDDDD